jgi:hypothetical protein
VSELESYHRILTIHRTFPLGKERVNLIKTFLEGLENANFNGKVKDEFGFVTDETIKRSMTLSDDKRWMKNIQLQTFSGIDSLPDKATEIMFARIIHTMMVSEK